MTFWGGFAEGVRFMRRLRFRMWEVESYSALEEECLTCENWSPLAELYAEGQWAE